MNTAVQMGATGWATEVLLATYEEKRLHSRFGCKGKAQVYFTPSSSPLSASVLNLSLGGGLIALQQPRDTELGESLEVAFTVNQLPFRVRAQVRSVRSDRVLGLRFVLGARVQGQLGDLLEELAANT